MTASSNKRGVDTSFHAIEDLVSNAAPLPHSPRAIAAARKIKEIEEAGDLRKIGNFIYRKIFLQLKADELDLRPVNVQQNLRAFLEKDPKHDQLVFTMQMYLAPPPKEKGYYVHHYSSTERDSIKKAIDAAHTRADEKLWKYHWPNPIKGEAAYYELKVKGSALSPIIRQINSTLDDAHKISEEEIYAALPDLKHFGPNRQITK